MKFEPIASRYASLLGFLSGVLISTAANAFTSIFFVQPNQLCPEERLVIVGGSGLLAIASLLCFVCSMDLESVQVQVATWVRDEMDRRGRAEGNDAYIFPYEIKLKERQMKREHRRLHILLLAVAFLLSIVGLGTLMYMKSLANLLPQGWGFSPH